jgi:multidrug efflux pump subunit AcrB
VNLAALRDRRFVGLFVLCAVPLGLVAGAVWYFFHCRVPARARHRGPIVAVVTYYKGMPAESIEKTITSRLERWVNQAPGSNRIESRSIQGVSMIRVYFRDDIKPSDALTTVNSLALGTLATLPPNTLPPVTLPVSDDSLPLGLIEVDNPSYDEAHLKDLARIDVRNGLGAVPGCVAPVVLGGKDRTIALRFDPARMEARNLSITDVVKALQKGNLIVPQSNAYFGKNEILLDNVMVDKLQELNDLPIRIEGNNRVFLRDIGQAQDSYAPRTMLVRMNGKRAVCVPVYNQQGSTAKSVRNGIGEELRRIEGKLPKGSQLKWLPLAYPMQCADDGLITLHVRAPAGSGLETTEKRIAEVEKVIVAEIPAAERAGIFCEVGVTPDWEALYTENAGPQDATLRIQLSGDRRQNADEYAAQLRQALQSEKFADLQFSLTTAAAPAIDIQVQAKSADERLKWARDIQKLVTEIDGAVDVHVVQRNDDRCYLVFEVDQAKAVAVGLSVQDVMLQVGAATNGPAPNFWVDPSGKRYLLPGCYENDPNDWLNLPAAGTTAADRVKLSSLVNVYKKTSAIEIDHVNVNPVTTVRLSVAGRSRSSVVSAIKDKLKLLELPAEVTVEVD